VIALRRGECESKGHLEQWVSGLKGLKEGLEVKVKRITQKALEKGRVGGSRRVVTPREGSRAFLGGLMREVQVVD
jgi:hypothetical protein